MEKRLIEIDYSLSALGPERTSRDLKLIFDDIVRGFNTNQGSSMITQKMSLVASLELPFLRMAVQTTYQNGAASVKAELKQRASRVLMEATFVDKAMWVLASSIKVGRFQRKKSDRRKEEFSNQSKNCTYKDVKNILPSFKGEGGFLYYRKIVDHMGCTPGNI